MYLNDCTFIVLLSPSISPPFFPDSGTGNVHTGVNFIDKIESCATIKFVRVTYVRPLDESIECATMYSTPRNLSYKTFIPAAVKVGMCSGAPEYEGFAATWERAKAWMKCVGEWRRWDLGRWHGRRKGQSFNQTWSQFHCVSSNSAQFHLINSNSTSNLSVPIPNVSIPIPNVSIPISTLLPTTFYHE